MRALDLWGRKNAILLIDHPAMVERRSISGGEESSRVGALAAHVRPVRNDL